MGLNILFINGPNLNLLGQREQSQYGNISYEELKTKCVNEAKDLGLSLDFIQSNIEGEIIDAIQNARDKYQGIIINAAGFTHTSVGIRDALEIFKGAKIEVHISNIYNREEFRKNSFISPVVNGIIAGFGTQVYQVAISSLKYL